MSKKHCNFYGAIMVVIVAGNFWLCRDCDYRECGHPDLSSKTGDFSPFQANMHGTITIALSSAGPIPTQ